MTITISSEAIQRVSRERGIRQQDAYRARVEACNEAGEELPCPPAPQSRSLINSPVKRLQIKVERDLGRQTPPSFANARLRRQEKILRYSGSYN